MNNKQTEEESCHFITMVQQKPIFYHPSWTLRKGKNHIGIWSSTVDMKHVILVKPVPGSGKLLVPVLIFKGQTEGRFAKKKLQTYPQVCFHAWHPKALMDKQMVNKWIDLMLIPWKNMGDPNIVPILVLKAYRVHYNCEPHTGIRHWELKVSTSPSCRCLCRLTLAEMTKQ